MSGAAGEPTLRLLPVPISEPRPALRVLPGGRLRDRREPAAPGLWPVAVPDPARPGQAPGRGSRSPEPIAPVADPLPDPLLWTGQVVQAAMEVIAGTRPANQLRRSTSPKVHAMLARRFALAQRTARPGEPPARPAVQALHACRVDAEVAEVSLICRLPGRVRAVAVRLQAAHGRWRIHELELG